MKVVINACYGGFGLSVFAEKEYCKRNSVDLFYYMQTKHKHSDGKDEYTRQDNPADNMFMYSFLNDFGETTNSIEGAEWFSGTDIKRDDQLLIEIVEEFGSEKTSGSFAKLKIVEIPDGVEWEVDEYDGFESIDEVHRSWS